MSLAPDDPRHGTRNGYNNLGCRCDRCKRAWADSHAEYMRNRRDRKLAEMPHSVSGTPYEQDCRAILHARQWHAAQSVARAMEALGTWGPEAQDALDLTRARLLGK